MSPRTSIDHAAMHRMNTSLILSTLRRSAPISRAGLASLTGMNKATVSMIVRTLLEDGLIHEIGVDLSNAEVGRPGINLALNPEAGYLIGIEIGVGFISIIATNFDMTVIARRFEDTTELASQEAILDRVLTLLQETYRQLGHRRRIFGIGVGVPGLVDTASGTLLFAPNLGWRDVPLLELLRARFPVPIAIANEANMAAFGESYFGAEEEGRFLVYVSSGVGLGGGIVMDGRLISGATGFAGEFGHMTVDPDGLRCNCGNIGCWETVASQKAVFRAIEQAVDAGQRSSLSALVGDNWTRLTTPLVFGAAQNGDAVARDALTQAGYWLGVGIANLINMLNPRYVIFGGPLSQAHPILLPVIKETVAAHSLRWVEADVVIGVATHAADATAMGGIAMIHSQVLRNPLQWIGAERGSVTPT